VAGLLRYPGSIAAVAVTRVGPSGRALEVGVDGSAGPVAIDAHRLAALLGLRSTMFSLRVEESDLPPPPPAMAVQSFTEEVNVPVPQDPQPAPSRPTLRVRIASLAGHGGNRLTLLALVATMAGATVARAWLGVVTGGVLADDADPDDGVTVLSPDGARPPPEGEG
jgi:hypothetical protein